MAVISKPFSARIRFINAGKATVQTLTKVNPTLQASAVQQVRQAINGIRRPDQPATGGFFTVTDELADV
jgi:hypothetical protein